MGGIGEDDSGASMLPASAFLKNCYFSVFSHMEYILILIKESIIWIVSGIDWLVVFQENNKESTKPMGSWQSLTKKKCKYFYHP